MSAQRSRSAGQPALRAASLLLGAAARRCFAVPLGLSMVLSCCTAGSGWAQSDEAAQRQRIARERIEAQNDYARREYDCSRRFAVTACIDAAKSERRARIDSLRRQEEVLDGNERRGRAAARLEAIEQKTQAEARLPAATTPASAATRGAAQASAPLPSVRAQRPARGEAALVPGRLAPAERPARRASAPAQTADKRSAADIRRAQDRASAVARADASRLRRSQVAEREKARASQPQQRKPSSPLPARPPVPTAPQEGS